MTPLTELGIKAGTIILLSLVTTYLAFKLNIKEVGYDKLKITFTKRKKKKNQKDKKQDILRICTLLLTLSLAFYTLPLNYIYSIILIIMLFMSLFDIRFQLVPDTLQLLLLASVCFTFKGTSYEDLVLRGIVAVAIFLLLCLVSLLTKGGIGGADVKLFTILSLLFGWQDILLLFCITYLVGAPIVILIYLIRKKKEIPLVPYITLATFITMHFSVYIIEWYKTTDFIMQW